MIKNFYNMRGIDILGYYLNNFIQYKWMWYGHQYQPMIEYY